MSPTHSEQSIFLAALELRTAAERLAYLKGACGSDEKLLANVEALLVTHDRQSDYLERPPVVQTAVYRPLTEGPGTLIGPYKLLQQIGEGGMGVVYMAEQSKPIERMVALKIIKPGMDTRQVVARFEAERQALAMMDHPNIAKVLDAGTTDSGRPYFVMELVKGVPITNYCDDHHLPPKQRLELFVDVLHAVQHAHQKGIIHRDIKPSNVLVAEYDQQPIPKVIDFGVAKATHHKLTDKTMFTQFGQLVGTLEYMSPEQAKLNQMDIDTRCDIYSLGVLLYELLSGETPFDRQRLRSAAFEEMMRIIREENPPAPSTRLTSSAMLASLSANRSTEPRKLSLFLRGELDWIVMRAMEKERNRRYETPNAFAEDIQRFLNQEAIVARPASSAYRLKKFTQRNWATVMTGSIVAATLLLGFTASTWLAIRESRARRVATISAQEANQQRELALSNQQEANRQRNAAEQAADQEAAQRKIAEQRQIDAQTSSEKLRHALYASNMNLVQSSWNNQQFFQVEMLLNAQQKKEGEPDLRGWEWHYWKRRLDQGLVQDNRPPISDDPSSFEGASHKVADMFFSGDGSRIVSHCYPRTNSTPPKVIASGTGEIVVNDRRDSRELLRFRPFPELTGPLKYGLVYCNYDCSRIAIYQECDVSRLAIFDGSTGIVICELSMSARPDSIDFDRAGNRLVATFVVPPGNDEADVEEKQQIQVWDIPSGEVVFTDAQTVVQGKLNANISPDGSRLLRHTESYGTPANQNRNECELVELPSGKSIWKQEYQDCRLKYEDWAQNGSVIAFSRFTPDQAPPTLTLWDAKAGSVFATLPRTVGIEYNWRDTALSPNGKVLAHFNNSAIQLYEVPSSDAAAGKQGLNGNAPLAVFPTSSLPREIVFSGDGEEIVGRVSLPLGGEPRIMAWKVTSAPAVETVLVTQQPVENWAAKFSPNGDRLAFPDRSLMVTNVWDVENQKLICQCELDKQLPTDSLELNYIFSQDGRRLMTVAYQFEDGSLRLWIHDTDSGLPIWQHSLETKKRNRRRVDLSSSGDRVLTVETKTDVTGSNVVTLELWDVQTGKLLGQHDEPAIPSHAFFVKEGREIAFVYRPLLAASEQPPPLNVRYVRFFHSDTFDLVGSNVLHKYGLLYDASHELISNSGGYQPDTMLYDLRSGEERHRFSGIRLPTAFTLAPDGKRIAFATTLEEEVRVCSLESNQNLLSLQAPKTKFDMAFSREGNRLLVAHLTARKELAITTWDATPITEN